MDDSAGSIEDRLFKFLLSRGLSPGDALSLAKAELANRAQDTVRNQEYARQNPGSLSREMGIDPSLPGSDPTAGPMTGGSERPRASTPMTNAQIDEMRITRPMVEDTRPSWVRNRGQAGPELMRMPTQAETRFSMGNTGQKGFEERKATYDALVEAKRISDANQRTMRQTYNPAGGSDAPSSENMVQRALAAVMGSTPPSSAAAAAANATPTAPSGQPASAPPAMLATPRQDEGRSDYDALFAGLTKTQPAGAPAGANRGSTPPLPAPRPAPEAETSRPGLFSGRDFQSTGQRVVERPQDGQRATLNWGDAGSAADFARADKAMQSLRKNKEEFEGRASGGAANGRSNKPSNGRDAALHKALEIIQSLLMHRR
tara:strand:- start:676 stop:1794 length:1119 start_codon:yes stop_codon:yes gene_type:complete